MNQSSTMTDNTTKEMPNTTYAMAIRNVKNRTTNIFRGQIDMESWKTLMMKNVRTTRYKMSNLII